MKIAVVDIGNTRQKAALYEAGEVLDEISSEVIPLSHFKSWKQKYNVRYLMYSSVAEDNAEYLNTLGSLFELHSLREMSLPFSMAYQTPESLGSDRLACMVAASALYPHQTVLVVQCGSCLTFDLLHGDVYQGGSIAPGLQMRFRALSDYTARLPLCSLDGNVPMVGTSTQGCIQAGVWHGFVSECATMIEKYRSHYEEENVILTGGDAAMLKDNLKNSIFAHPNLVMYGLYVIMSKYV